MLLCYIAIPDMDDSDLLRRLSVALNLVGMPTQMAISRELGVDQPLVSRARRGQLRRVTPRVRNLCEYADRKASEIGRLKHGRDEHTKRYPTLAQEVLTDCRAYLDEGCDPLVLRDQLKVLRRAQGVRAHRGR